MSVVASEWSFEAIRGRRYETAHFNLYSTVPDLAFEEALPAFLEEVYAQCVALFGSPAGSDAAPKLAMYIFGTRQAWDQFTRRQYPHRYETYARIHQGGFTEEGTSVSFYAGRAPTLATLAHETWHQYATLRFGAAMPPWLNEGLGCYVEAVQVSHGRVDLAPLHNTYRINSLCEGMQAGRLLPLPEVLASDVSEVMARGRIATQVHYAQLWALVTFLRHGDVGRYSEAFDRMLMDIAAGRFRIRTGAIQLADSDADSADAAFRAYFGAAAADLEDDYFDHIARLCGF